MSRTFVVISTLIIAVVAVGGAAALMVGIPAPKAEIKIPIPYERFTVK